MTAAGTVELALSEGRLADAIAAVTVRLKASAIDRDARLLLAELLCLSGAFERAEAQLAILAQQDLERPVAVARMRHLVRAAVAREAWFNTGAVPSLLAEPTAVQRAALALGLALREGDPSRIAAALAGAEATRPNLSGIADGQPFDELRDADDRSAWFLEIFTGDGGYLWVDWSRVAALQFASPPSRPIDLLWRPARMTLHDGTAADIVVPAQYVSPDATDAQRLSQATDWTDGAGGAVTGQGQRVWLIGEDARDILSLSHVAFAAPAAEPAP